jgi:hypothetical protein
LDSAYSAALAALGEMYDATVGQPSTAERQAERDAYAEAHAAEY